MGSPPVARRHDTLRRCPGVASGSGRRTLVQPEGDSSSQAASAVVESFEEITLITTPLKYLDVVV